MKCQAPLSVVVAAAANTRGIGRDGNLPWRLAAEMKAFVKLTTAKPSAVIMGRNTWESIPEKFRPLKNRLNVVLTKRETVGWPEEVLVATSLDEALQQLHKLDQPLENIFVIGGARVYAEAMARPDCDAVYLTQVYGNFECDTFFPEMEAGQFRCVGNPEHAPPGRQKENDVEYEFFLYKRVTREDSCDSPNPVLCAGSPVNDREGFTTLSSLPGKPPLAEARHEEYQYLDMIRNLLANGNDKGDRTGTGTLSTFGTTMRFSLRDNKLPLLTTKRVFWRGVAEELLWFVSGDTNAKSLQEKNIHIWDGNGSREFLDKIGLSHREEGDLGPVYGFQWRHFGAEYKTMHDDYTGKGVDQLRELINTIKTNPNDRRMIVSAWNPAALKEMALPPCHMFSQFYVANGELSCQMYQRSADMGLGVPFNIASYALLTHLLAHCTGLKAGEFIHVIGDCHVYKNHIEPLKEQLEREPREFPTLKINTDNKDIDGFTYDDLEVVGYKPHKTIKMDMSV